MESCGILDCTVRVEEKSDNVLLGENHCEVLDEKSDLKNFQLLPFTPENSICTLPNSDIKLESELDDEVEIVVECEDVKPNINLFTVKKCADDFQDHFRNVEDRNDYKIQTKIKMEPTGEVKQEFFGDTAEQMNSNVDCELVKRNEKRKITEKLSNVQKIKTHLGAMQKNWKPYNCDTCGKKFRRKDHLKHHIDSVHNGVTHTCDICQKTFTWKSNLKSHIDSVHSKITQAYCNICGKIFSQKSNLKIHVESVHRGVTHACDTCGKKFSCKGHLKTHFDSAHNGVTYACDICGKSFTQKGYLKSHSEAMHKGVTPTCDICGLSFSHKSVLKNHIV